MTQSTLFSRTSSPMHPHFCNWSLQLRKTFQIRSEESNGRSCSYLYQVKFVDIRLICHTTRYKLELKPVNAR